MIKLGPHKKNVDFFKRRTDNLYAQITGGKNIRMFNRAMMAENIQYALGEQDRWRYKKRPDEITQNDRNMLPTSDWRNSKLLYKIIKTMVTLISKRRLMPSVTGIDSLAREQRGNIELQMKLAQILKRIDGNYQQVAAGIGMDPDSVPITDDGLRVRLTMQPQLREEMDLELGISKLQNIYKWEQTDLEVIKGCLLWNIGGVVVDLDSCMPNIRAFNAFNGICDNSHKEDCSDINEAAEVILVPLWKLEAYAKDQFTDWNNVKAQARTYDQIVSMPGFSGFIYMAGAFDTNPAILYVPVLHASWKETRNLCKKTVRLPNGTIETFLEIDVDPASDKRDIIEYASQPYEFVFTCKRILGTTNQMYDAGLLEPQNRFLPVDNPKDKNIVDPRTSELNFVLTNPNVLFGRSISIIEELKPEMDSLQRATDKFNATLQAYIPQSIEINMDLLAELEIGTKKQSKDQILAMFERKGILLTQKTIGHSIGPNQSDKAIAIIPNDMSSNLERLQNTMDRLEQKIERLSGIAATEMGQVAGNRVSNALNESMISGQNNVLGCYFRSRIQVNERLNFQLMIWLMRNGDSGVFDGKEFSIDKQAMRKRLFNMSTVILPTEEQWAELKAAAQQAYNSQPPKITWADYWIISQSSLKNIKELSAYFAEREAQGIARNMAEQERLVALNNEGAQMAAQAKTKGDLDKIQAKESMINQRSAMVEQAKGMTKEAELTTSQEMEYLDVLKSVNPQAANDYVLMKLGQDPNLYRKQVDGLVDVVINPPEKQLETK